MKTLVALTTFISLFGSGLANASWKELAPGLDLGAFTVKAESAEARGQLTILRVDASRWDLDLLTQRELELETGRTARKWSAAHHLVAATNAGMFATDYLSHLGFLKRGRILHTAKVNRYQSVAAFGPTREGLAPFRIFDLDAPGSDMEVIRADYEHVVQNLRLIKKPGENRWSAQNKRWSEAALAEDRDGRALLIFSRTPFSMREFNQRLLDLGIGVIAAQHLEGGPEAQLFVQYGDTTFEGFGSFESGFREDDSNSFSWPVPNVIGVRAKDAP